MVVLGVLLAGHRRWGSKLGVAAAASDLFWVVEARRQIESSFEDLIWPMPVMARLEFGWAYWALPVTAAVGVAWNVWRRVSDRRAATGARS